jgi:transcriptional regulator with XRE-family HTH domain
MLRNMDQTYAALRSASRVRAARKLRGLSVAELADAAGLTKTTVYRIEAGQHLPQMRTARRLADALGVAVESLLLDVA